MDFEYCKLEIYIPASHFPALQKALQSADAGHIGKYDCCLSYCEVQSRWRPLAGSRPFLGEENTLCTSAEYKVEVICRKEKVDETIRAVKSVHPYEEPVINAIPLYRTGLSAAREDPRKSRTRLSSGPAGRRSDSKSRQR